MTYNPDSHHRRSIRLRNFDYASAGAYFVTICAYGRECLFGAVDADEMVLNDVGRMIEAVWHGLPSRFPGIELDEFVVMPNHVHFVVFNVATPVFVGAPPVGDLGFNPPYIPDKPVSNDLGRHKTCPYNDKMTTGEQNRGTPYGETIIDVIGAFKSITTHEYSVGVKQSGWVPFAGKLWQRNYYERVIRTETELDNIRHYIRYNPLKWADDEENPNRISAV